MKEYELTSVPRLTEEIMSTFSKLLPVPSNIMLFLLKKKKKKENKVSVSRRKETSDHLCVSSEDVRTVSPVTHCETSFPLHCDVCSLLFCQLQKAVHLQINQFMTTTDE